MPGEAGTLCSLFCTLSETGTSNFQRRSTLRITYNPFVLHPASIRMMAALQTKGLESFSCDLKLSFCWGIPGPIYLLDSTPHAILRPIYNEKIYDEEKIYRTQRKTPIYYGSENIVGRWSICSSWANAPFSAMFSSHQLHEKVDLRIRD